MSSPIDEMRLEESPRMSWFGSRAGFKSDLGLAPDDMESVSVVHACCHSTRKHRAGTVLLDALRLTLNNTAEM